MIRLYSGAFLIAKIQRHRLEASAYFRAFSKKLRFFTKKVKKRPLRFLYIEGVNLRLLIKGGDF